MNNKEEFSKKMNLPNKADIIKDVKRRIPIMLGKPMAGPKKKGGASK